MYKWDGEEASAWVQIWSKAFWVCWPALPKDICRYNPLRQLPQQRSVPNTELADPRAGINHYFRLPFYILGVFAGKSLIGTREPSAEMSSLVVNARAAQSKALRWEPGLGRGDDVSMWNWRAEREERMWMWAWDLREEAMGNLLPGSGFYQDHGAGVFVCFSFNSVLISSLLP